MDNFKCHYCGKVMLKSECADDALDGSSYPICDQCWMSDEEKEIQRLTQENEALQKRVDEFIKIFSHIHMDDGKSDKCALCGLNLRNKIHLGPEAEQSNENSD